METINGVYRVALLVVGVVGADVFASEASGIETIVDHRLGGFAYFLP